MCGSTDLPMRRNSPTSPCRLMAIRMLRTVMPSQKHTTTRALGRWALSRSSSRSKLCSPALLQILPGKMYNVQVNWPVKVTYNSSHNLLWKCHMFTRKFDTIACTQIKYIQLWCTICSFCLTRVSNTDALLACHIFECFHATFTIVT